MEKKEIDLSIIILSHNSKRDLARLFPSLFGPDCDFNYEVIVVDNGSSDGTINWAREQISKLANQQIRLVENQNFGFARGNNLGIKQAQGKYILILNPDTELKPDTLKVMVEFMENHPEIGISTCKVLLPNGKLDLACRRRFPNPWNSFSRLFLFLNKDYNYSDIDEDKSMEIDSCMGAFMMIRQISGLVYQQTSFLTFDEDFFMYGEDLDLCKRIKQAGYKVWYYPKTSITHYKGSSSRKVPYKALKWFHDAMWIFYTKHHKNKCPFILNWVIWAGIKLRFIILVILNIVKAEKFVSKR